MRQLEMEVICTQSPETIFVLKEPIKHDKTIKKMRLSGIKILKRQMRYYRPTSKHIMSASRQPEIVERQEKPKEEL